jgi:hypothetical protein
LGVLRFRLELKSAVCAAKPSTLTVAPVRPSVAALASRSVSSPRLDVVSLPLPADGIEIRSSDRSALTWIAGCHGNSSG